jgi:hypothetical protein
MYSSLHHFRLYLELMTSQILTLHQFNRLITTIQKKFFTLGFNGEQTTVLLVTETVVK